MPRPVANTQSRGQHHPVLPYQSSNSCQQSPDNHACTKQRAGVYQEGTGANSAVEPGSGRAALAALLLRLLLLALQLPGLTQASRCTPSGADATAVE